MCTVTWLRTVDGYELLFNRDELKSRAEARPPRERCTEGVRWIAPEDPDGGGTWLATSEHGLTIGVLNGPRVPDEAGRVWTTRGCLAPALLTSEGPEEVGERLHRLALDDHRPFRLLAIAPSGRALVAEWDGRSLAIDGDAEERVPLISSGFDESAVGTARRAAFVRIVGEPPFRLERLLAFHRNAEGGPNAYTVSMERPEACTRSLTHVTVTPGEVTHRYFPGRADLDGPGTRTRLVRTLRPFPSRPAESP